MKSGLGPKPPPPNCGLNPSKFFFNGSSLTGKLKKHLHPPTDHYRLTYSINYCPNFRCKDAEDWNFKKLSLFKNELELGLKNWSNVRIWSAMTIEKNLEQFSNQLVKALDLACPKKRSKRNYKFPTWWDQNLSKLRSKLRFLAKKKDP